MRSYKRIADLIICLGFILLFGNIAVFAANIGEVNDVAVNIRSESNTSSKILGQANTGFRVNINSVENGFYHITANGFESAYISTQFVDLILAEGEVSDDKVNIRKQPSTSSEVLNVLDLGKKLSVVGVTDTWYVVDYNGQNAYIHKDYVNGVFLSSLQTIQPSAAAKVAAVAESVPVVPPVVTETPAAPVLEVALASPAVEAQPAAEAEQPAETGQSDSIFAVVNSNTGLKLRSGASLNADIIKVLPYGEVLDVLTLDDTWTYVELDGVKGYVSSEFITISRGQRPERIVRTKGQQVIDYAKQFLGTPYVYGGNSLTKGVDCSGFVFQVMNNFGTKLSRNSSAQYNNGTPVKKADLQTGDLVFFNTSGSSGSRISHVGIYIGNGQFIHSSSSKKSWGITISSLNEAYYVRTYVSACRVLS